MSEPNTEPRRKGGCLKIVLWTALVLVLLVGGLFAYLVVTIPPDVDPGATLPDVALTTLDGSDFDETALRGKIVLLDFWSST